MAYKGKYYKKRMYKSAFIGGRRGYKRNDYLPLIGLVTISAIAILALSRR